MSEIVTNLANLFEAIDSLPSYPFRADVRKASDYLQKHFPPSEDVAALYLRNIVKGARPVRGFAFGSDLETAEAVLRANCPSLAA